MNDFTPNAQQAELIDLLWNNLKSVKGHSDRRHTAWGTKTKRGLVACVERIYHPNMETIK